eukprot:gene2089-biopygen3420
MWDLIGLQRPMWDGAPGDGPSIRQSFMFVVLTIGAPQFSFPGTSAAATLTTTKITAAQLPEQEQCGRVFSLQRRSLRCQQKVWRLECTLQRCYKGGVWFWAVLIHLYRLNKRV